MEKIKKAYEKIADNYNALIENKPHNAYYDRPNTLKLIGEVKNKNILDAACGPGKYAEIFIANGANVTGFDLSPRMVQLAKERNGSSGFFFEQDLAKPFKTLSENSFDIVVCALAMQYVKNWNQTITEFHRVLKNKGTLVISIEHPFFEYTYYNSSKYFLIEQIKTVWKGFGKPIEMLSYRRPLYECLSPITNNGFYIEKLVEPIPTKEFKKLDPKHFKELNEFPAFMCLKAVRK
ncbi:class I SAM-dependent methyltransferase [Aequorivita antarctica]|nr:class I SAM-dependent methyltransferase [Aequorivita antarctica]SRX75996.1 Malonyl-[acyl-carrier protein] O-methyltransferase [Aequorivita antarctica]